MGRMIDILRTADRRPVAAISLQESGVRDQEPEAPPSLLTPEPCLLSPDSPELEDDNEVPFIEVGGPREPSLRIVPAPAEGPGLKEIGPIGLIGPIPSIPHPQNREREENDPLT